MANTQAAQLISLLAAADHSAKQYYCVKVDSNGRAAIVAAAGDRVDGIIVVPADAQDRAESVQVSGVAKCIAAGPIARGALVAATSAGKVDDSATLGVIDNANVKGSYIVGVALEAAAADGDVIEVLLRLSGVAPTTVA